MIHEGVTINKQQVIDRQKVAGTDCNSHPVPYPISLLHPIETSGCQGSFKAMEPKTWLALVSLSMHAQCLEQPNLMFSIDGLNSVYLVACLA